MDIVHPKNALVAQFSDPLKGKDLREKKEMTS